MKKMNYNNAAAAALRKFEWARKTNMFVKMNEASQFRQLTVMESVGTANKLTYVLFEVQFCDENGENYRSVWIRVRCSEVYGIDAELDTSTIQDLK